MSQQFRSPQPLAWDRVYRLLLEWHRDRGLAGQDTPPVPLVLAGRVFSSSSQKHERWVETVNWAKRHGCHHLVELANDDFEVSDRDIPAWDPADDDPSR